MDKGQVTALVTGETFVEWSTLRGGMGPDRLSVVSAGRADFGPPAVGAVDGAAPSRSSQIRSACRASARHVTVGLATTDLLLRVLSLPSEEDAELAGMVRLQVDKFCPFPIESVVISHEVLRRAAGQSLVLVAIAKRRTVDTLGETLSAAGYKTLRLDAGILGWWRLLVDAGEWPGHGREAALIMDGATPELMVVQEGLPLVMRSVCQDVPAEQRLAELISEIRYTLMALEIDHGSQPTGAITLWCRGEEPSETADALAAACDCPVHIRSLDTLPPLAEGLARRSLPGESGRLDLTPDDWRRVEAARVFRRRLLVSSIGLVAVWVLLMIGGLGSLRLREAQVTRRRAEQLAWREQADAVRAIRDRVFTIRRYMVRRYSALECFREICVRQTEGVELNSFSYRKGEGVKISGLADTTDQVYAFKKELDAAPLFANTMLDGPQRDDRLGKWRFDIDIQLPGDES